MKRVYPGAELDGFRIGELLHKGEQNAVHLDLKMGNVIIQDPASSDRDTAVPVAGNGANKIAASHFYAVLIDFGLSYHAHYPDLLAEEMRKAVGSPAYMAPEQVVGVRGDPRSDVFSIGVILYELATGELPFGSPSTTGGLRQRLWVDPVPPRKRRPDLPEWLQEVIMRCLEPTAAERYPSAAHRAMRVMLEHWASRLDLSKHQASYHVLESNDVAEALVRYAELNNVSMIVLGAATHGLQMQRFVATVPIRVAMRAPCTVILVKQSLPSDYLGAGSNPAA